MSLTVTEANAALTLAQWLADEPYPTGGKVGEAVAIEALEILLAHAGKTLQMPAQALQLWARVGERLAAADSDGSAQAVCRAIEAHLAKGGSIPWPSIRSQFAEWQAAQRAGAAERVGWAGLAVGDDGATAGR